MAIYFHNQDTSYTLQDKSQIESWLHSVFRSESEQQLTLRVIICSDEYLLDINQKFLQHDDLTDVITFPLHESKRSMEAEIYISIDRITENSTRYGTSVENELRRIMVHGVLHLLGYEDKSNDSKATMRAREDHWLKELNRNSR